MAQGHIIPFLALAKLIAQRHPALTVTLLNTPLNIQTLQSSNLLPPNNNVHLKSLPYRGTDFGLPPGAENTDSLPLPSFIRIFDSSDSLQPHFAHFLSELTRENNGQPPLLIIADVFLGWTVDVARSLGVLHATFTTCGALGSAAYMSLWLHLPHVAAPPGSREFNVPGFPETFKLQADQMSSYLRAADGNDPWSRFFRRQITRSLRSDAIVCNTVEEVETEGLRLLRRIAGGLRVFPVGPLLPLESNSSHERSGRKPGVEAGCIVEWLDSYESGSVVYVSFGSQNTVSASQMMSLAAGLESSGHPFVWVVRPPLGFDLSSEFRPEWLPQGFEERMRASGRGILIRQWAPQLEILSHDSTGAFLSHCGWNSVLESLSRGVCIIGWPLASEQFYNSKMVEEELRVGTELARGTVEEVTSDAVEAAVRMVIEGDEGREMKERAGKYREMIREAMREEGEVKGSSIRSVDELIEMAMSPSRSRSVQ